MAFFADIRRNYGHRTEIAYKQWKKRSATKQRLHQQLKFLLRCRQEALVPKHIYESNINNIQFFSNKNITKFNRSLTKLSNNILNLEIDDLNYRIWLLNKQMLEFEKVILTTPKQMYEQFFTIEENSISRYSEKLYMIHEKKLNYLRHERNLKLHKFNINNNDFLLTIASQERIIRPNNNYLTQNTEQFRNDINNNNYTHNPNFNLNHNTDTHYLNSNNNDAHNSDCNNNYVKTPCDIDPFFEILRLNKTINNDKQKGWLVNLSDKTIPPHIEIFLSLGQRFCYPYIDEHETKNAIHKIISEFEYRAYLIPKEKLDTARGELTNILSMTKTRTSKKDTKKVITDTKKFLKENTDIVITRADKGNSTVILNKDDYINKTLTLLNDENTYKKITSNTRNPCNNTEKAINNILIKWKSKNIIDDETLHMLKPENSQLSRLYTLPKIHKTNAPMRPIVSSIQFPTHKIADFIRNIIQKHMPPHNSDTKDSFTLKKHLQDFTLPPNHILVSFDVVSLYTSIPLRLVLDSLEKRKHYFNDDTGILLQELKMAIEFIMSSTFFQFNSEIYQQISGLPMGSPLAPILANLVMIDLEEFCLSKLNFNVPLYKRYVDDCILALPIDKIDFTLDIFNQYDNNIRFTSEIEVDGKIPFLDLLLIRENQNIITNWYRKPTWSGRYLNYFSNHPIQQKIGIINMLIDRAINLSHKKFWNDNIELIKNTLFMNFYPESLISRTINKRLFKLLNPNHINTQKEPFDTRSIMNFPYFTQIHYPTLRMLKNYNINLVTNNKHNISKITGNTKDKIETLEKTNVVYEIPCKDCESRYIGQTKRHLKTRIQEHKRSINHLDNDHTALARHVKNTKHNFDFDKTRVLENEENLKKRLTIEMIKIKKEKNSVNYRTDIEKLSIIYNSVI